MFQVVCEWCVTSLGWVFAVLSLPLKYKYVIGPYPTNIIEISVSSFWPLLQEVGHLPICLRSSRCVMLWLVFENFFITVCVVSSA